MCWPPTVTVFSPTEKLKDVGLQAPKPVQHPLHPVPAPHHTVPSLISSHGIFSLPGNSAATALLIQRTNEEEKWLARQRRLRQEKEDRQSQVSEFRQQVLEQHLDLGRPTVPTEVEHRPESTRWVLSGTSHEAGAPGSEVRDGGRECTPVPSVGPSHALLHLSAPLQQQKSWLLMLPVLHVEKGLQLEGA